VELPYNKRDVTVDYVNKSTCQIANKPASLTIEWGAETRKCYQRLLCLEIIAECEVSYRHGRYHAHKRRWNRCLFRRSSGSWSVGRVEGGTGVSIVAGRGAEHGAGSLCRRVEACVRVGAAIGAVVVGVEAGVGVGVGDKVRDALPACVSVGGGVGTGVGA
jgi:hypothetical protein